MGVVFIGAVYNLILSSIIVLANHFQYALKYVTAIFFLVLYLPAFWTSEVNKNLYFQGPIGFLFFQFAVAYYVNPNFSKKMQFAIHIFCGKHQEEPDEPGAPVKNVFGKVIVLQDNITDHFNSLKRQWAWAVQ